MLEGHAGRSHPPPAGHRLIPGEARRPSVCGHHQVHGVVLGKLTPPKGMWSSLARGRRNPRGGTDFVLLTQSQL